MFGLIGGWSNLEAGVVPVAHLFGEKLFDIGLAFVGTLFGYCLAKLAGGPRFLLAFPSRYGTPSIFGAEANQTVGQPPYTH